MNIIQIIVSFAIGVIATIVGTYLLDLSVWKPFKDFRKMGVLKVFKNQKKATKSIREDIEKSSFLYVFAMRGESFSSDENEEESLSKQLYNAKIEHKYFISSLDNSYLQIRNSELGFDMSDSITQSIKNLKNAQIKNTNIEIKQHKEVVRFRMILLSHCLYLSFQKAQVPGKKSSVLKIDKNSAMYHSFYTLFDDLWNKYPLQ